VGIPLDDDLRRALEAPTFWHLATVNPDGSPHSTPVWVHARGDKILVNSALGRRKVRNIEGDPRVALSFHETTPNGYRSWAIQGRVAQTIVGDQAEADIDMLAQKYLGVSPYPWRSPGERRVTLLIEPTRVSRMG
jgi:PPOX class probable F420-dependent enzyme